jgi:DNA polymerase I-like protein with 3'-5' exonuclease and polymerase domains
MDAYALDIETTQKCPVGNNKASPFWPDNKCVVYGHVKVANEDGLPSSYSPTILTYDPSKPFTHRHHLLIGHNIDFDLQYMLRDGKITKGNLAGSQVWDTQLAEYLLTGQQAKFASLDECASKYGGTLKDDRVTVMFKSGMGADEVPRSLLDDYLKSDIENTRKVFFGQYADAVEKGMLPLIQSQMDAKMACIEMRNNGLAVDKEFLEKGIVQLQLKVARCELDASVFMHKVTGLDLNPSSTKDLGLFLFGGTAKTVKTECVGKYKNGKDKFKKVETLHTLPPAFMPKFEWKRVKGFSTDDKVIEELLSSTTLKPEWATFLRTIQELRECSKELSTYYEGIDKLIMPDGRIHHDLNQVVTVTGRLSSSNPNLQNITDGSKSEIKKAFVSRWGDDGVLIEADYSQLEMVMLAVLSKDTQLLNDIRTGVDMHKALFRDMYGREMKPEERKPFKRCSFALVYGAGAKGIAEQSGMSLVDAKRFIATFYSRYSGVKAWHDSMYKEVESKREYFGDKDAETGIPIGKSTYVSPFSKRRFVFREYPLSEEVKRWKKGVASFSPTEVKNYPVQGGATGDIVPLVFGKLYRVLRNHPRLKDSCLMVNTVHDSVLFDVRLDVVDEAIYLIRTVMENAPAYIKETFGIDFPLQLKVGMSRGPTWFDQSEINFESMKEAA